MSARAHRRRVLAAAGALACASDAAAAGRIRARVGRRAARVLAGGRRAAREHRAGRAAARRDALDAVADARRARATSSRRSARRRASRTICPRSARCGSMRSARTMRPIASRVFRGARAATAAARGPLVEEILAVQPQGEGGLAAALETRARRAVARRCADGRARRRVQRSRARVRRRRVRGLREADRGRRAPRRGGDRRRRRPPRVCASRPASPRA